MWTLLYHPTSTEKTFADWGIIDDLPFEFVSQGAASVDIITVDGFDTAFQWAYAAKVTIFRDRTAVGEGGSIFFAGYVAQPRRLASGERQNHRYTLLDWWWLAERTPFRRGRKSYEGSLSEFPIKSPTEVVLFEDVNANPATTREAVLEVFTLMNECWNPTRRGAAGIVNGALDVVADGVIETDLAVMRYPIRDTMCSEVLQMILAWTQDAIIETDYSVHPPIVSVRRLPNMPTEVVTLPADRATGLELKPRYDLQLAGVMIWYKKIHSETVDNTTLSGQRWYVDKWPADLSDYYPDARIHTVDLEGSGQSILTQKISAASIAVNNATNSVRVAWWQEKFPWLADIRIKPSTISVTLPTAKDKDGDPITDIADFLTDLPNELTAGSISQWMGKNQAAVTFTAKVSYERYNDPIATPPTPQTYALLGNRAEDKSISCQVLATNAGPGSDLVFKTFAHFDTGEAIPYGLAQQIFESHETLQHEGIVELVGGEIPERLRLGILITLVTPGATYEDMLIQRVSGDLSRGRIKLQVGPPKTRGIMDMIELHMVSRYRTTWNLPSNAANPVADIGANYSLPEQTHRRDSTSGSGGSSYDAVTWRDP